MKKKKVTQKLPSFFMLFKNMSSLKKQQKGAKFIYCSLLLLNIIYIIPLNLWR